MTMTASDQIYWGLIFFTCGAIFATAVVQR